MLSKVLSLTPQGHCLLLSHPQLPHPVSYQILRLFPSICPLLSSSPGHIQPVTTAPCPLTYFHVLLPRLSHSHLPQAPQILTVCCPCSETHCVRLSWVYTLSSNFSSPAYTWPTVSPVSSLPFTHCIPMSGRLQPGWYLCIFGLDVPTKNILYPLALSPFMIHLKPPACCPPLLWLPSGLTTQDRHSSPAHPLLETHCICSVLGQGPQIQFTYFILVVTNTHQGQTSYPVFRKHSS